MKLHTLVGTALLGACALTAHAQSQTYTETTRTEVKPVIITGEVLRYEPGHVIVIRSQKGDEVSYTLMPSLVVPAEVRVGRTVTLYTEPGEGGSTLVKRVTTTSVTPSGNVKRTTEETRTSPTGEQTTTTTTTVSGTVQAFEAGKSITITREDGSQVTYMINTESQLPAGLVIGRRVTIYPSTVTTSTEPMVQRVVFTKTKSKTNKKGETKTKTETHHKY